MYALALFLALKLKNTKLIENTYKCIDNIY